MIIRNVTPPSENRGIELSVSECSYVAVTGDGRTRRTYTLAPGATAEIGTASKIVQRWLSRGDLVEVRWTRDEIAALTDAAAAAACTEIGVQPSYPGGSAARAALLYWLHGVPLPVPTVSRVVVDELTEMIAAHAHARPARKKG